MRLSKWTSYDEPQLQIFAIVFQGSSFFQYHLQTDVSPGAHLVDSTFLLKNTREADHLSKLPEHQSASSSLSPAGLSGMIVFTHSPGLHHPAAQNTTITSNPMLSVRAVSI